MTLGRIHGALVVSLAIAGLVSCAASTKLTQPLQGTPPTTIAVLPLDGGNLTSRGRVIARRLVGSALEYRRYQTLDDDFVDQRLALAGYQPWKPKWIPSDAELATFGRQLGVDAVFVGENFEDSRFNAGVFFRRGVTGKVRLVDVATGKTVWAADAGASGSGGVLTGSGQVVRAISETIDAESEIAFGRFMSSIALDLMDVIPENPRVVDARPRPQVDGVSVATSLTSGATLHALDLVEIGARGTSRGRASASLGGKLVDYPLVEVSPGVYSGTIRVEPGTGDGHGPVAVQLIDAFGVASEPRRSEQSLAFNAPRIDAPAGLAAEIIDRMTRRVRLRWEPIPGAMDYLVSRSSASGLANLAPVSKPEIEDSLPADATSATYFVAARLTRDASGPKSRPIAVTF